MSGRFLQVVFFVLVVRLVVLFILGLNIRYRQRLPVGGPAIIVANHNSHLDTLVLMSLIPLRQLHKVRPVAAMDYFMKDRKLAWFARTLINILPIQRTRADKNTDPLADCTAVLDSGEILIFFPEGTRGEAEQMSAFKSGIARLAERHPDVPVVPVYMHGLGKALPKGETLLVPFFCDVFIGEKLSWQGNRKAYMEQLDTTMHALAQEGGFQPWE